MVSAERSLTSNEQIAPETKQRRELHTLGSYLHQNNIHIRKAYFHNLADQFPDLILRLGDMYIVNRDEMDQQIENIQAAVENIKVGVTTRNPESRQKYQQQLLRIRDSEDDPYESITLDKARSILFDKAYKFYLETKLSPDGAAGKSEDAISWANPVLAGEKGDHPDFRHFVLRDFNRMLIMTSKDQQLDDKLEELHSAGFNFVQMTAFLNLPREQAGRLRTRYNRLQNKKNPERPRKTHGRPQTYTEEQIIDSYGQFSEQIQRGMGRLPTLRDVDQGRKAGRIICSGGVIESRFGKWSIARPILEELYKERQATAGEAVAV